MDRLQKLERIRDDLNDLIREIKAQRENTAPPPPPPPEPPAQAWTPSQPAAQPQGALPMRNPFVGRVTDVTEKSVPLRKGGFTVKYIIQTAAGAFETFKSPDARVARESILQHQDVMLHWNARVNGRYTNYDVLAIHPHVVRQGQAVSRG